MKNSLKTFPHRSNAEKTFLKNDNACEWVDANIRCPEYHKWLKDFEAELRRLLKYYDEISDDVCEVLREILGEE